MNNLIFFIFQVFTWREGEIDVDLTFLTFLFVPSFSILLYYLFAAVSLFPLKWQKYNVTCEQKIKISTKIKIVVNVISFSTNRKVNYWNTIYKIYSLLKVTYYEQVIDMFHPTTATIKYLISRFLSLTFDSNL